MCNIIDGIQKDREDQKLQAISNVEDDDDASDEVKEFTLEFDEQLKKQSNKNLKHLQQFTDVIEPVELNKLINTLNSEQRKFFDDLVEREVSREVEKDPYPVYIAGYADTGKSYLTSVLMEAFKLLNFKSGTKLSKP